MKAIKYQVKISDSPLDALHGFNYSIWEIFIPSHKIAFNENGGLFKTDSPRTNSDLDDSKYTKTKEINITKKEIESFIDYLIRKENCANIVKQYFPKVDKLI